MRVLDTARMRAGQPPLEQGGEGGTRGITWGAGIGSVRR